jgi:hypothetical protein
MKERLEQVTTDLAAIADDAQNSFAAMSIDQLNWKPAGESWSIAQCLDHIVKTNHEFYPEFDRLAAGGRKNTFWQNYSPFTGMAGRFLVNAVTVDSKKAKAPSKSIVPPSDIEAGIVDRFARNLADVSEKVMKCYGVDLKKTVVSSPFLSIMTYTLDDALSVLVEHSKRHIRQAKRVTEASGFPG